MNREVLNSYLLHLLPAFAIPVLFYVFDNSIPLTALIKIGLLFPLLLLALKGLASYFPQENLKDRSIATVIEYALLQGMVFSAFMVVFADFLQTGLQPTIMMILRQFLIGTAIMTVSNIIMALNQQKTLRNSKL